MTLSENTLGMSIMVLAIIAIVGLVLGAVALQKANEHDDDHIVPTHGHVPDASTARISSVFSVDYNDTHVSSVKPYTVSVPFNPPFSSVPAVFDWFTYNKRTYERVSSAIVSGSVTVHGVEINLSNFPSPYNTIKAFGDNNLDNGAHVNSFFQNLQMLQTANNKVSTPVKTSSGLKDVTAGNSGKMLDYVVFDNNSNGQKSARYSYINKSTGTTGDMYDTVDMVSGCIDGSTPYISYLGPTATQFSVVRGQSNGLFIDQDYKIGSTTPTNNLVYKWGSITPTVTANVAGLSKSKLFKWNDKFFLAYINNGVGLTMSYNIDPLPSTTTVSGTVVTVLTTDVVIESNVGAIDSFTSCANGTDYFFATATATTVVVTRVAATSHTTQVIGWTTTPIIGTQNQIELLNVPCGTGHRPVLFTDVGGVLSARVGTESTHTTSPNLWNNVSEEVPGVTGINYYSVAVVNGRIVVTFSTAAGVLRTTMGDCSSNAQSITWDVLNDNQVHNVHETTPVNIADGLIATGAFGNEVGVLFENTTGPLLNFGSGVDQEYTTSVVAANPK
jgi:hypothetical protein